MITFYCQKYASNVTTFNQNVCLLTQVKYKYFAEMTREPGAQESVSCRLTPDSLTPDSLTPDSLTRRPFSPRGSRQPHFERKP